MNEAKCVYRIGQKVAYAYANEYTTEDGMNFKVVSKHVPLGCFPRYTITNGTISLSGVREKDLTRRS